MKKIKGDLIVDIGKSNIKFTVFSKKTGEVLKKKIYRNNYLIKSEKYKEIDHKKILKLIERNIVNSNKLFDLSSILPITHGSVFFLLNGEKKVLRCISDESNFGKKFDLIFQKNIKKTKNSYSPTLDYCHNLSKSLFYVKKEESKIFKKVKYILLYPNFISYKLCNKFSTDLSYLSNHSFLWDFKKQKINKFAKSLNLHKYLPKTNSNLIFNKLGKLEIKKIKNKNINIYAGKHDSSCSFHYYKMNFHKKFSLISTGTWIICYDENKKIQKKLVEMDVHLANSVMNEVVSVARYPGGHELKYLNKRIKKIDNFDINIIDQIYKNKDLIIPSFYKGGPFKKNFGKIKINSQKHRVSKEYNYHLNLLYISCMTFYSLSLLGKKNVPIIIDGIFIKNKFFVNLISNLSNRKVFISDDENGVSRGGFLILQRNKKLKINFKEIKKNEKLKKILFNYYHFWKKNLPSN